VRNPSTPPSYRSGRAAAHRQLGGSDRGSADLSRPLDAESPEVCDRLEALDDAMFAAIAGSEAALDRARELWQEALATLGWELLEESREQYLRYAAELTRRFEAHEIRNPAVAVTALEVIQLLDREA
jgi:hypothetical protein